MKELERWVENINSRLRELLKPFKPEELYRAMSYYLFQEGKRIRPLFLVAVADELGGDERDAITLGCAIEMIHNYSLIHDDLPALDDDDFRRGRPSCHREFGEAMAILAGDALLTYAFEVLSDIGNFLSLSPQQILLASNVIARKAGIWGMVSGQVLDIGKEEDNERISLLKTAALFEASFICGGICASYDNLKELEVLGRNVGLLFQITDDILDRDGYYETFGEGTLDIARKVYGECREYISKIFTDGTTIEHLVNRIMDRVS